MKRVTTKQIERALIAAGIATVEEPITVIKDKFHYWFCGGYTFRWYTSMVYVTRLSDLTVDEWVAEAQRLINETVEFSTFCERRHLVNV